MAEPNDNHLRFPIGKFSPKETYSTEELDDFIKRIEELPDKVAMEIKAFTPNTYDVHYREGGWSARQVLHHLADSHMNAYIRFKWALTEDTPVIKTYNEKAWAETPETSLDPSLSVQLLKALHAKWVSLLKLLTPDDLDKYFVHPETNRQVTLQRMIALYAWHGDHHLEHLKIIRSKN